MFKRLARAAAALGSAWDAKRSERKNQMTQGGRGVFVPCRRPPAPLRTTRQRLAVDAPHVPGWLRWASVSHKHQMERAWYTDQSTTPIKQKLEKSHVESPGIAHEAKLQEETGEERAREHWTQSHWPHIFTFMVRAGLNHGRSGSSTAST